MEKEPTAHLLQEIEVFQVSKSQRALLDDLDRLVAVASAQLAHRIDFARAKRQILVGTASYNCTVVSGGAGGRGPAGQGQTASKVG